MAKKRLGIDALFQSSVPVAKTPSEAPPGEYREVPVDALVPGSRQPRRTFDPAAHEQLTSSVVARGVLQPLLVRPRAEGAGFEIVAGERRWRAAKAAGLDRVPVRVVALDDAEALVVALTENLQREDLSPIDEAEGYLELLRSRLEPEAAYAAFRDDEDGSAGVLRVLRALNNRAAGNSKDNVVLSLEPVVSAVFDAVGRLTWQSFVAHRLPLLSLPPDLLSAIRDRGLAHTKARAIAKLTPERLGCDEPSARRLRRDLLEQALAEGLSVRDLSREIARLLGETGASGAVESPYESVGPSHLAGQLDELRRRLGAADLGEYEPGRRAEISSAIDTLLRLL